MLRIFKIFEITRTIYSNSERSEQLLVTECFFNLFLEVSQIKLIRTIIIQIGKKKIGFRNMQEKLVKKIFQRPCYLHNLKGLKIPFVVELEKRSFTLQRHLKSRIIQASRYD